jgi:hypothetical protein
LGKGCKQWVTVARETFDWLTGKKESPPLEMSKHDRQQWSHIIEPAANDRASQMVFTVSDNGRVVNTFVFNSHDANVAKKAIDRQIEAENAAENNVHRRNVMN